MQALSAVVILFVAFAFVGWLWELLLYRVQHRRWVNPGFLQGPWVPVYGFGGVFAVWATASMIENPWLVFIVSASIATILEYITHWLLERVWGLSLWDYTEMPYDLHGRICLPATLLFGLLALLAVYVVQPFVFEQLNGISVIALDWAAGVVLAVLVVDFATTLGLALSVRRMLRSVEGSLSDLSNTLGQAAAGLAGRNQGLAQWWKRQSRNNQKYIVDRLGYTFPNIGRRQRKRAKKRQ